MIIVFFGLWHEIKIFTYKYSVPMPRIKNKLFADLQIL